MPVKITGRLISGRTPQHRSILEHATFRPEFIDIPGARKSQLDTICCRGSLC
jgi:hypothetical protein